MSFDFMTFRQNIKEDCRETIYRFRFICHDTFEIHSAASSVRRRTLRSEHFFLREESRNYFKELEVETSALADTRVCLTDAGDGAYYLMLPEADSSKAHFILDGEYSASIDGAALTQKIAAIPGVSAVSLMDHDGKTSL